MQQSKGHVDALIAKALTQPTVQLHLLLLVVKGPLMTQLSLPSS